MKKATVIGIATTLLYAGAYAFDAEAGKKEETNVKGNISKIDAYRIGYADGYEKGKVEGIEEGWRQAVEYFKQVYNSKIQEYKEMEAGRILIKNWRVSYPKVYQIQTSEGSRVVVEGCKITREYDDLLEKIPIKPENKVVEYTPSISISQPQPQNVKIDREITKKFAKAIVPSEYLDKINSTDVVYFKNTNEDSYTVYFKTDKDKEMFCSAYGVCR